MSEIMSGEEYSELRKRGRKPEKKRDYTKYKNRLPLLVVILILCGLSFWGGTTYQKNSSTASAASTTSATAPTPSTPPTTKRFRGARPNIGTVTVISPTSITINNIRTGASQTFAITSATKLTSGSNTGQVIQTSNINVGDNVMVRASVKNATDALAIIDNPTLGGFGGPQAPATTQL